MADSVPLPPSSVSAAASQFGPFDGRIWLNTAHQGPLPQPAVVAAADAVALKVAPHRIADDAFDEVPERLRTLLAGLVGSPPDQIVLGNSTSYGLHLVANGLPWRAGDEVLVLAGDYPATVLPWQRLSDRGVTTTALHPAGDLLTAGELAAAITDRTRVCAVTWVDSFTGRALDLNALGTVCRQAGVLLVVNASQALGARPLDVTSTPVDAGATPACATIWASAPSTSSARPISLTSCHGRRLSSCWPTPASRPSPTGISSWSAGSSPGSTRTATGSSAPSADRAGRPSSFSRRPAVPAGSVASG